jgi:hypothetical protein
MPLRRKLGDLADDLGEYILALGRHWGPIVSGAALGIASYLYGIKTNASISPHYYLWILVAAAIVAGFFAWRNLYRKQQAQERPRIHAGIYRLRADDFELLDERPPVGRFDRDEDRFGPATCAGAVFAAGAPGTKAMTLRDATKLRPTVAAV